VAFAIKVPLFLFHVAARCARPRAHRRVVILAGVLLKMGTYG
jgi:NADH:ubiquinone oxidoreductase subunit 4 (subunit M)